MASRKTMGLARAASVQRVARWREMAADLKKKRPHWDYVQIARHIQKSSFGKRRGGQLPFTVAAIVKYVRGIPEQLTGSGRKGRKE